RTAVCGLGAGIWLDREHAGAVAAAGLQARPGGGAVAVLLWCRARRNLFAALGEVRPARRSRACLGDGVIVMPQPGDDLIEAHGHECIVAAVSLVPNRTRPG